AQSQFSLGAEIYLYGSGSAKANENQIFASDNGVSYTGGKLRIALPASNIGFDSADTDITLVQEVAQESSKLFELQTDLANEYTSGLFYDAGGQRLTYGEATQTEKPHTHKPNGEAGDQVWTAWDPQTTNTLDDGYYYLVRNYDDLKAITVTGDAHLCLNGHEMSDNGRDADFITVNRDASLTICDCSVG